MPDACEIHGVVFKNASAVLLARVVGADGQPLRPADVVSAQYTAYALDTDDPDAATPLPGHTLVDVPVDELLFDQLQIDQLWDLDNIGYNFRHVLDVSHQPIFTVAGRHYRIEFRLTPQQGQVIVVRFRLYAI